MARHVCAVNNLIVPFSQLFLESVLAGR